MKLIFESETELGPCDPDRVNGHFGEEIRSWSAYAHTTAVLTGSKGMLRIEQRCYLRSTEQLDDIRTQNWVKPEMAFEATLESKAETVAMVQGLHERFVAAARATFSEQALLLGSPGIDMARRL